MPLISRTWNQFRFFINWKLSFDLIKQVQLRLPGDQRAGRGSSSAPIVPRLERKTQTFAAHQQRLAAAVALLLRLLAPLWRLQGTRLHGERSVKNFCKLA